MVMCILLQLTRNLIKVLIQITLSLDLHLQKVSMLLVVSMYTCIWFATYHSCICHIIVYVSETYEMRGKTYMLACAYKYVWVQFMQTKCAHGNKLMSCVCTHALDTCIFISSIFHARAGYMWVFSETCWVTQLPHTCVVKFKFSCTIFQL